MDAYLVFGPYHFFNAINLKIAEPTGKNAVLYIFDRFRGAEVLYNNIKQNMSNLFNAVYFIRTTKNVHNFCFESISAKNNWQKAIRLCKRKWYSYYFPKSLYSMIPNCDQVFENLFIAGINIPFLESYLFHQIRSGCKIHIFDDGLHSRNITKCFATSKAEKLNRLLGLWMSEYITDYYFYSPKQLLASYNCSIIQQISPSEFSNQQKKELNQVYDFSVEKETLINYHALYFSLPDSISMNITQLEEKHMNCAQKIFGEEYFAIKWHPLIQKPCSLFQEYNPAWPFEISCLHGDIDNMVFISMLSAVMFNPKFIFNKEPYLVFTHNLCSENISQFSNSDQSQFDQMIKQVLIPNYRNPEKILIPKNEEEYVSMLKHIQYLQKNV